MSIPLIDYFKEDCIEWYWEIDRSGFSHADIAEAYLKEFDFTRIGLERLILFVNQQAPAQVSLMARWSNLIETIEKRAIFALTPVLAKAIKKEIPSQNAAA